jgi:type IV secretion system protein VirB1
MGGEQLMKTTHSIFGVTVIVFLACLCIAQQGRERPNSRLSYADFRQLAEECAPDIPLVTLRAIARTESAFHPYALSLNYPRRTAREHGMSSGGIALARQPRTLTEAQAWTQYLLKRGRSVSVGLMQVNSEHLADLNLTADQLFDPCTNIRAAARLLTAKYQQAAAISGDGQAALQQALSEYNSGSAFLGVANGYVTSVIVGEFDTRQPPQ